MGDGAEESRWVIGADRAVALLRVILGILFLSVFFDNLGKGLYTPEGYARLVEGFVRRGDAPALWKAAMRFMADHAAVAAPLQAALELSLGLLLSLGLFARLAALAAFGFLASLWVSEWGVAWVWELLMPMMVALVLILTPSGRTIGLDAAMARRFPRWRAW